MVRYAFFIVLVASVLSACTAEPWKRSAHNVLNRMECENQTTQEDRASCIRTYDEAYGEYQRARDKYLRERQEEIRR